MSAVVGALRAILSLESAAFTNGLKQAQSGLKGFSVQTAKIGKSMQRIGAITAIAGAGIAAAIRGQLNLADDMGKAAQKFGVPVEQLSKLAYAAKLSDVSLETLGTGLRKLSQGMATNSKAFAEIGVQTRDASGALRDTESVLQDVSAVFASMPDGAEKTALAMKLFGKSGTEMIPMLNMGKQGLADMAAEAEKLGIVISADTAKAAENYNDNLTRLATAGQGLAMQIAATLAPALESLSGWLVGIATSFADLTPGMQSFAAWSAGLVVVLGPLIVGLGVVVSALGAIATAFGPVLLGLAAVSAAITAASIMFPRFGEIVSEVFGTLGGAVVGAAELMVIAINGIVAAFQGLIGIAKQAAAAVTAALSVSPEDIEGMDFSGATGLGFGTGGTGGMGDPGLKAETDAILNGGSSQSYSSGASIGSSLADGIADGFSAGMSSRSGDIAATAGMADTIARDRLGVQSPSKVFRQIGAWLTEGLSLGMKDNVPMVGEAMGEIGAEIKDGADSLQSAVQSLTSEFKGLFGGIVTGAMSGREALASLASKLADMLANSAFDSLFGGVGPLGGIIPGIASIFGFAKGGVFSGGNVMAFANGGIVGGPMNFAMAGGNMGLMGEAGPEAIMPLTRGPGGKLGVQAHGGGGTLRIIVEENPMFASRVQAISSDTAVDVVRGYDAEIAPVSRGRPGRERG